MNRKTLGLIDLCAAIGGSIAVGLYANSLLLGAGTFLLVHAVRPHYAGN